MSWWFSAAFLLLSAVIPRSLADELTLQVAANEAVETPSRNTVSLEGNWAVSGDSIESQVHVPAVIPLQLGITTWSREFTLDVAQTPPVAFLEFGGIVNSGRVFVNDVEVGELLAFTRTRLEVAHALNWSDSNTLSVELDDRLTSQTIPGGPIEPYVPSIGPIAYTIPAAWENTPGIPRSVSLVYSPRPLVLDTFAIQSLNADLSQATVDMRVKVMGAPTSGLVATVGLARNGELVQGCLAQAASDDELSCTLDVESPALWSLDAPNLYDIWVGLYDADGLADSVQDRTGFRRFEVRENEFYLNNERLFLRGITRHGIYGNSGFVADQQTIAQDLYRIKALGVNYIRAIHYPPDPRVTALADELGILLSQEIPAWAFVQGLPELQDDAVHMFQAMVERDFNSPSVVIWIVGNGSQEDGRVLYPKARAAVSHIENQRPMTYIFDDLSRSSNPEEAIADHLAIVNDVGMDFYAINMYSFFYPELAQQLPTNIPVVSSEWSGSESSARGPIGEPGVIAFPGFDDVLGTGVFPEWYQAWTMFQTFQQYLPYTDCANVTPCISGMVFFNWQDVAWPAFPYIYAGHGLFYRNGLVYPDREGKAWPLAIFQLLMGQLP